MTHIYLRLRETFFSERDLITARDEDEILLTYVIPSAVSESDHQWFWQGGRCYFGPA